MRPSKRRADQMRPIRFTRQFLKHPEGSVLVEYGDTKVICTASITDGVPKFLKDSKQGWLTAEYGMLPRATHERTDREASRGKQTGRTVEISRLIGRSLRAAINLKALGDRTITIDCDVIQADGGTRTAAITGGCIALFDAVNKQRLPLKNPLKHLIASVSVGIYQGEPILDLDYIEDSNADTDMNIVMNENGDFIEIQGTAEGSSLHQKQLNVLLELAQKGIGELIISQRETLKDLFESQAEIL